MKKILLILLLLQISLSASEALTNKVPNILFSIDDVNYTKTIFPKEFENFSLKQQKYFIYKYVFYKLLLDNLKEKQILYNKEIKQNIGDEQKKQKRIGEILSPFKKMFFKNKIITDTIAYEELLNNNSNINKKALQFYKKHQEDFYYPERVELSIILLKDKKLALKIIKEIKKNDINEFSKFSKKYSISSSSQHGGYIGYVVKEGTPNFDILYNSLKNKLLPKVLKSKDNYIIYYILNIEKEEKKKFSDLKNDIKKFLLKEKIENWKLKQFKEIKKKVKLKSYYP